MKKDVHHLPCFKCGSSDAVSIYYHPEEDKTQGYCFSCQTFFTEAELEAEKVMLTPAKKIKPINQSSPSIEEILSYPIVAIPARGLTQETCEHFGIRVSFTDSGEIDKHYYPYTKKGKITGFKVRQVADKEFYSIGDIRGAEPFGWNNVKGSKFVIIAEGEIDAASIWQMNQPKYNYNVVSLANSKTVKANYDKLVEFSDIILAYDCDKVGRKLAETDAQLFAPGQVRIASWEEYKDPNEILLAKQNKVWINAMFSAKDFRPDGIIKLSQSWDMLWQGRNKKSVPYPWEHFNQKYYGMREKELVTLTGGSGTGKTQIFRQIQYHLLKETNDNIGILHLEEDIPRVEWGLLSLHMRRPLHIVEECDDVTPDIIRPYWEELFGSDRVQAYDHFGSTAGENLLEKIRYLIKVMDCKWIFLDHLSIVVSDVHEVGDERKNIDSIMTQLKTLSEETKANIHCIVHLSRPGGGKSHEQGEPVSLSHLRGSHSIAQLSNAVIAFERNQQSENIKEQNLMRTRALKNRYAGKLGPMGWLVYDDKTTLLTEVLDVEEYLHTDDDMEF